MLEPLPGQACRAGAEKRATGTDDDQHGGQHGVDARASHMRDKREKGGGVTAKALIPAARL